MVLLFCMYIGHGYWSPIIHSKPLSFSDYLLLRRPNDEKSDRTRCSQDLELVGAYLKSVSVRLPKEYKKLRADSSDCYTLLKARHAQEDILHLDSQQSNTVCLIRRDNDLTPFLYGS